ALPFSGLLAFLVTAGRCGGAEVAAVVLAEGVLLALAELLVPVDIRGALDLVLGHGKYDPLAVELGSVDRREAMPGTEQAGFHENPQWLPRLVVEVHLADLADPAALGVHGGAVDVSVRVLRGGHNYLPYAGCHSCGPPGRATSRKACDSTLGGQPQTALRQPMNTSRDNAGSRAPHRPCQDRKSV